MVLPTEVHRNVTPDGRVRQVQLIQPAIRFSDVAQRSAEQRMFLWRFPASPSGQAVTGVIGFGVTCFIPDWP